MFAASRGFGIAGDAVGVAVEQAGVAGESREAGPVRGDERNPVERDEFHGRVTGSPCDAAQFLFKLAADEGFDTQTAEIIGVDRRVQSVAAEVRRGVHFAHLFQHRHRKFCGSVHGQMKRDQTGRPHGIQGKCVYRQVRAGDLVAVCAQHCCR